MKNLAYFLIILLFCLVLIPTAMGQEEPEEEPVAPDWVSDIDPYDETSGDFLDVDLDILEMLAWESYRDGEYEEAARLYLAYLQFNAEDNGNIYNLACCYGLLGEAELAGHYLEAAFEAGWNDLNWALGDPDFESVKEDEIFIDAVDEISQNFEASQAELPDVIYNSTEALFECNIKLPENFDPEKSYNLVVGLHGMGAHPDSFINLWNRFDDPQFIYISPRGPYPRMDGFTWFRWEEGEFQDQIGLETMEMSVDYVRDVVLQTEGRFNVDEVYLLGFSQGCGLSLMAGIRHHDVVDGIIGFGGWLDTDFLSDDEIAAANGVRVFLSHGDDDQVVPFENSYDAMEYLHGYDYDVMLYLFEGVHQVPEEALLAAQQWINLD